MKQLTHRIENLSPAKRALLEMKLREKTRAVEAQNHIPLRANRDAAPVSFNQESLWFLEQLTPNTSRYNLYDAMRLTGTLVLPALEKALATIVARHEVLRTSFQTTEGKVRQVVTDSVPLPLATFDLTARAEAEREAAAQQLLLTEAERPFDLAAVPLVRFTLIKLSAEEHLLLVLMHHIISDGWSVGIFWQEFTQLYESYAGDEEPALPELPIQFGDYAAWLQEQLCGETVEKQLNYWKTQLANAPALLELPTDRPRPAVQSYRGAQKFVLFPDGLRKELKALSNREGVTLFMTLLSAFNVLLARYTGQEDLVVGSPLAGRTHLETEKLIGFFVNVLPLRTDLSDDPVFRDLLQRVRDIALDAYSNQSLPFEKLVEELRPERSLSYNPIFQTAFALQNECGGEVQAADLKLNPVKIGTVTSKFDLFLSLCETPHGLRATVEYSTDLFDAATIERLLQHYQNLLEGIVANPEQRISELPLLSAAERHQLLIEWNQTSTDYPSAQSIQSLFEQQAERHPHAVAVIAGDDTLTYGELNRRANQVAHYLREKGVGPDTLIGLFTERSLLMVIGVLGILKAGGAYLPLDPGYPQERLSFMLADAQAPVILTQQHLQARLPKNPAATLCLDSQWDTLLSYSASNPVNLTQPDHLAYVIYTSGSTGQPKGAAIPHRAVNRLVFNTNYVQLTAEDRLAQVSNIAFDAATFELWGALLHGARLVLISKDIALSPNEFVAQLRTHGVTTMFVTTALFNLLAREEPTAFSTLKTVMFGGEACDPQSIREVLKNGAPQRLLHVYGPTESTTFASWHLIEAVPEDATTVPIGRPLSNTTIYLLDRHHNPVPVGVPGELYVGGDGLARGYLNRPELTAEKFVAGTWDLGLGTWGLGQTTKTKDQRPKTQSPITSHQPPATSRLYRTGDLARYLPDGSIEFVGRIDHQIKLRGFRVELGEIEAALLAHPAIQDAIVIVRQEAGRDKQLTAYFVVAEGEALEVSELRQHLLQKLPDYMIPSAFVRLASMPLNSNGKVDRSKLPVPDESMIARTRAMADPKDELELRLKWIWEQVLGVSSIGVRDNFFELGGHSLIAVRLFTEINKTFGRYLPLATLFQSPTIEQLAMILREQGWQPSWSSLVPLRANGTRPPFFCVHAVGGNVLEYNDLARYLSPAQPFYGLQSVGLDGQQLPLRSIEKMAAHYIEEMQQLQPNGPYYLGGRSFGGAVAFEMARQLQARGEQVALLAMLDTYPLGWLKLLPPDEARRLERHYEAQHMRQHLKNMKQLGWRARFAYVIGKARYKKRKVTHWFWRVQKTKQTAAQTMSDILRNIEEINYLASKQYVPQVYPGRVTFFSAIEEVSAAENIAGWQTLARDGVEVIEVPGDHQTMIKDPDVQVLAQRLQESLEQAQQQQLNSIAPEVSV